MRRRKFYGLADAPQELRSSRLILRAESAWHGGCVRRGRDWNEMALCARCLGLEGEVKAACLGTVLPQAECRNCKLSFRTFSRDREVW